MALPPPRSAPPVPFPLEGRFWKGRRLERQAPPFDLQQARLRLKAAAEAGERAVRADHPMTGDDDRDRVGAVGPAHRAGGAGAADLFCDLAVAAGLAEGDPLQRIPDRALEGRPLGGEREVEIVARAGEVLRELAAQRRGMRA